MVTICMKLLEWNNKYLEDPAQDVSARATPIYVGRTISAMVGQTLCPALYNRDNVALRRLLAADIFDCCRIGTSWRSSVN